PWPQRDDLPDDFRATGLVVVVGVGRFEDEATGLYRRHLIRVINVSVRAERHPPRAFEDGDVAVLIVEVRLRALSRRPPYTLHVHPRFPCVTVNGAEL